MSRRRLRPDEQHAWARVLKTVRPLLGHENVPDVGHPADENLPESMNAPKLRSMRGSSGPSQGLSGRQRPANQTPSPHAGMPANRVRERRIRRGQISIAARLDLHGHTQVSAARILPEFLANAQARGVRTVLVITGKGRLGEGVLRRRFLQWLEGEDARTLVSGFAGAHAKHGGAGAFYVFLRRY